MLFSNSNLAAPKKEEIDGERCKRKEKKQNAFATRQAQIRLIHGEETPLPRHLYLYSSSLWKA